MICFRCKTRERHGGVAYCRQCSTEKMREWRAKYPERNREIGRRSDLVKRAKTPVAVQTSKRRERQHRWKMRNPEEYKKQAMEKYHRIRDRAIEKLGAQCACCEEKRETFLQVDHIHNDGYKEGKRRHSYDLMKRVLRDPEAHEKYQVLCANCNHSKTRNYGLCQHYTERWFAFISDCDDPYPYPYAKKQASKYPAMLLPHRTKQ